MYVMMYVMIINKRIEYVVVYNVLKRIKCAAFGSTPTPDFVRSPPLQNAASAADLLATYLFIQDVVVPRAYGSYNATHCLDLLFLISLQRLNPAIADRNIVVSQSN